ncbi:hypothetical protein COU76_02935 [Candidatus Peregrinibacteria bacterium CG10_big_fil_rev_8_21_14_0_10_49_10]|nr:MAG: hypothetical protein COU76_02935 [Candidatus Peregrinibacteria bacterium CG10_big_fil_rev_8_21_14_0_10_49_10]
MTYLLVGNYGVGNLGDEALREYFLQRFPDVQWRVVSAHPQGEELPRFPCGLRSFFSCRWIRTFRALRRSNGMVLGGGSLFTDVESVWACVLWWVHVCAARLLRKRVILAFQGIGPFRTTWGERFARSAVRVAYAVSVRDAASYQRIQTWKRQGTLLQSFDPVLALVPDPTPDLASGHVLIAVPRENSGEVFLGRLRALLQGDRFTHVRILSLKPHSPQEKEYCALLQSAVSLPCTLQHVHTLQDLISGIAGGELVLTERFHGGVVALALGKELEVVPQKEGDKLDALAALLHSMPVQRRKERLRALVQEGEDALRAAL